MPHERLHPSFNLDEEKLNELKQILPEAFADGKINWDVLKECLGDYIEDEDGDVEHFGLFWPGKKEASKQANIPSKGTLISIMGEGIDEKETDNIFIEGENLEVLKLLQKGYSGQIKMIYIDPPYNTGNDFVYEDNFVEPIDEYLKRTGQIDDEGKALTTNRKSDGRFHSNWLSMIYPRLKLARNLLSDEGVVMISIDDTEVSNIRLILNEIFGEENYVNTLIWKKRYNAAKEKHLASIHEYVMIYAKLKDNIDDFSMAGEKEYFDKYFTEKDKFFSKRGYFMTQPLEAGNTMDNRKNLIFPIQAPDGSEIFPRRQWIWKKEKVDEALKNDMLSFKQDSNGNWSVRYKNYMKDEKGKLRRVKPFSIYDKTYTQEGTKEITEILGKDIFSFPKPTKFLSHLLDIINCKEGFFLDMFSGSSSFAHSVLLQNFKDQGKRSYICIQMAEQIDSESTAFKNGYKNIAEIGKERIRRVIKLFKSQNSDMFEKIDCGFKVFKLSKSNFKLWNDYNGNDLTILSTLFSESPLVEGWTKENLLNEIILSEGFHLNSNIKKFDIHNNDLFRISSNNCEHNLIICLDDKIQSKTISDIIFKNNDIFICLDSAISDDDKMKLSDNGNIKTI